MSEKRLDMITKKPIRLFMLILILTLSAPFVSVASNGGLHPFNQRLIELGYMPYPKYFPEVPRIPVYYAKKLWEEGEARFIFVSYQKKDLIVGAVHLDTEVPPFDISQFKLTGEDQVIVVY